MSSPFFPYETISKFFEAEGDFPENLEPDELDQQRQDAMELRAEQTEDEVRYEDCQGYDGGCGSPSCLTCNPEDPCCLLHTHTYLQDHEYGCPSRAKKEGRTPLTPQY